MTFLAVHLSRADCADDFGLLFQNPEKQLFENTVHEEVAFPLKRLGVSPQEIAERVKNTLAECGIAELAHASPHLLSYGQKHLVAMASVLGPPA